eukprot:TRINITY_DN4667_c0_g5_i1.p1 TRINITY_DN4667_c0_g5~~TRINITY_DN4667_c0_g5_i1.p1  ORF type:complete len:335 (-),score=53.80 TRINITY_DN4667_c0_g5_i1:54-1058(-)
MAATVLHGAQMAPPGLTLSLLDLMEGSISEARTPRCHGPSVPLLLAAATGVGAEGLHMPASRRPAKIALAAAVPAATSSEASTSEAGTTPRWNSDVMLLSHDGAAKAAYGLADDHVGGTARGLSTPVEWSSLAAGPVGAAASGVGSPDSAYVMASIGSMQHPYGCGAPCRYVRRKGGCRDGPACPYCHFCVWRRETKVGGAGCGGGGRVRIGACASPGCGLTSTGLEAAELEGSDHLPAYVNVSESVGWSFEGVVPPPPPTPPPPCLIAQALGSDSEDAAPALAACAPSLGSIGHPVNCRRACKYFGKRRGCKEGSKCERCHLCPWTRSNEKFC